MSRSSSIAPRGRAASLHPGHGLLPSSSRRSRVRGGLVLRPAGRDQAPLLYRSVQANHRGYVPPGEEVFTAKPRAVTRRKPSTSASSCPTTIRTTSPAIACSAPTSGRVSPRPRRAVSTYYQSVFALGRRLLQGFSLALGLPVSHFDALVRKPPSQLRLVHYPASAATAAPERWGSALTPTTKCSRSCTPRGLGSRW